MEALQQWVSNAPADDFWKITITLLLVAGAGFFAGFLCLYRKRIIQDTPTSKIRSAAQGYVELDGTGDLLAGESLLAPLSATPCIWYSYDIAERRSSGKRSKWVIIEKGTSDRLFRLLDDTGECLIDPEGASVTPAIKRTWYGSARHPVADSSMRRSFFTLGRQYRYREHRLHPQQLLYAIGLFKTTGGRNAHFDINADVRALIAEWKQESEQLLAGYDRNNDGTLDLQEWERVREAALENVRQQHNELKTLPPVHIMAKTCDRRRPYLLSAFPEPELLQRLGRYSGAGLAAFFFAGLAGSWLLITRLGG